MSICRFAGCNNQASSQRRYCHLHSRAALLDVWVLIMCLLIGTAVAVSIATVALVVAWRVL